MQLGRGGSAARTREVDHEYLFFEDEGHGVVKTKNTAEHLSRTVSLFQSAFET